MGDLEKKVDIDEKLVYLFVSRKDGKGTGSCKSKRRYCVSTAVREKSYDDGSVTLRSARRSDFE